MYGKGRRLLMVGAVLSVLVAAGTQAVHGQQPAGYALVTVRSGDSLWSIAAERYPQSDPRQEVGEIMRLNHLADAVVYPGEELKVPAA